MRDIKKYIDGNPKIRAYKIDEKTGMKSGFDDSICGRENENESGLSMLDRITFLSDDSNITEYNIYFNKTGGKRKSAGRSTRRKRRSA